MVVVALDAHTRQSIIDQAARGRVVMENRESHYRDEANRIRGELSLSRREVANLRRSLTARDRRVTMLEGEARGLRRELDLERRKGRRLEARVASLLSVGKRKVVA